jgi:hypothetical protein
MINERAMLRRFSVLQQFPDVPPSIQSHYADILSLAKRADELAQQHRRIQNQMKSSARSLDGELDGL